MDTPFEKFSLDALKSEQKPSVKSRSIGPVRNRSTGVDFEIYQSGRENPDRFHLWCKQEIAGAVEIITSIGWLLDSNTLKKKRYVGSSPQI